MADVTGDLGGQPIQLNNAATEATLKQLLQATLAQVAAQGKSKSTQDKIKTDLEKELKRLAAASKKTTSQLDANAKAEADQQKQKANQAAKEKKLSDETIKSLQGTIASLDSFQRTLVNSTTAISGATAAIAGMGNSMTAAASAMAAIPVVGGVLASVLGTVAASAEKSYKAFQQSASVGANFGGSINTMIASATDAGMTIDGFTAMVAKNSESLIYFGTGINDGAKKLAELGKQIRSNEFKQLNSELANLGYSTQDINEGMVRYQTMLAKTGKTGAINNAELLAGTGEYLKNLDAVAKLTGKSKEALQKEEDARQTDAQFRVAQRKLSEGDRKNLDMLMNSMSKTEQEAFKGALATGTMNEAMQKLNVVNPKLAQELMNTAIQAKQSGKLSKEAVLDLDDNLNKAAKAGADNATANTVAAHQADKYGDAYISATDRAARTTNVREQLAQQEIDTAKKIKEGMDPESMKKFQENIAALSNKFTQIAGQLAPKLISAFEFIEKIVSGPLAGAFTLIGDHLGKLVLVLGATSIAMAVYKRKLAVEERKAALRGTFKDPMYVQDVGGGGGRGGGKGKKGGKLGNLGIGKIAGGAGALGAVAGVVSLAGDLSDISDKVKSGELSETDASKARGGAVGGAAGGAGGAWAGAAAGAAIGSVIPVIGTAVGGLLGGAIGYFVGNKVGETAGEAVGKAVAPVTKATKEQTKATKSATEQAEALTREQKKATEAAITPPAKPDWYNPDSTLAYYRDTMKSPGASAVTSGTGAGGASAGKIPEGMQAALAKQGITDPKAVANILAQVQAESGGKAQSENLNYSGKKLFELYGAGNKMGNKARFKSIDEANAVAKAGPEAVGNVIYGGRMGNAGDEGFKYRGRGLIQLTGKDNYAKFGKMIGVDLVGNPDLANDPNIAQQLAAAYFAEKQKKGTNLADINAIGKAVGYAGGSAETAKRAQLAQGFSAQMAGTAATPTASTAQAAVTPAVAAAVAAGGTAATTATQSAAAPVAQENPTQLLAQLNTTMQQLVAITKSGNEKQLRATNGMSGNLYAAV